MHTTTPRPSNEQLWTINDLAAFLRVGRTTAYEVAASPSAPKAVRIGSSRRWFPGDWVKWAERRRGE
jgi:predicted DNA-binding transcriptional regulator AlpA